MLKPKDCKKFNRDVKKFEHQPAVMKELRTVIEILLKEENLDPKYCDHPLGGNWRGHRECHVKPDALLIYKVVKDVLRLERFGSQSSLFS
jgi:mRNA interferase YafQ